MEQKHDPKDHNVIPTIKEQRTNGTAAPFDLEIVTQTLCVPVPRPISARNYRLSCMTPACSAVSRLIAQSSIDLHRRPDLLFPHDDMHANLLTL